MGISDWSSDLCASDLRTGVADARGSGQADGGNRQAHARPLRQEGCEEGACQEDGREEGAGEEGRQEDGEESDEKSREEEDRREEGSGEEARQQDGRRRRPVLTQVRLSGA